MKPIVRKLSLTRKKIPDSNFNFPEMPKLYLELLENKDKIKQQLVNKEYMPCVPTEQVVDYSRRVPVSERLNELMKKPKPASISSKSSSSEFEKQFKEDDKEFSDSDISSDSSSVMSKSPHSSVESFSRNFSEKKPAEDDSFRFKPESIFKQPADSPAYQRDSTSYQQETYKPADSTFKPSYQQETYKPAYQQDSTFRPAYQQNSLPSLSQLNMKETTLPDLNYMSNNAEEEDLKRELMFKFELLRKSYKDANVPEFSIHSDYKTMKQTYDNAVKRLSIDSTVSSYKTYLIGGFMVVEYALGNWMGFDMQGFTQHQISSVDSYERLLTELGEKSYVDEESQWPVEVRLLGMIILNAAFFIVSKMITKKTGSNILNYINSMNTNSSQEVAGAKKKRPMRGPNINIDSLPDLSG